jgi:hypothetical protein
MILRACSGKYTGGADDHHGFDSFRLERRHVEQGIAAHADADGPAARDAEMIEQGQGVERALAMRQCLWRIGGPAMTAGVGRDELVLAHQLIASGIGPIAMTAGAAMQQQERRAGAVDRVMQVDAVHLHGGFGVLVCHRGCLVDTKGNGPTLFT